MEALQSFLEILANSEKNLSPMKGKVSTQKDLKDLKLEENVNMFIRKLVKDSNLRQLLMAVFNQHMTISHANGILPYFIPLPAPKVPQSLITCHINTVLVLSSIYYCYIVGCLPQPVTSNLDDIVSVIYTSGSTGFAKG